MVAVCRWRQTKTQHTTSADRKSAICTRAEQAFKVPKCRSDRLWAPCRLDRAGADDDGDEGGWVTTPLLSTPLVMTRSRTTNDGPSEADHRPPAACRSHAPRSVGQIDCDTSTPDPHVFQFNQASDWGMRRASSHKAAAVPLRKASMDRVSLRTECVSSHDSFFTRPGTHPVRHANRRVPRRLLFRFSVRGWPGLAVIYP